VFTIEDLPGRLAELGDLHEPVLRERQRIPARLLR
jgi:hypothetical protein